MKTNQVSFIKQEINSIEINNILQNPKIQEKITILKNHDLKWKNDLWKLMSRYLDTVCYTTTVYKYRMHYEMILSATGSGEFQHFYLANTRKVYNFSKIIIKKKLTPEEWEMSLLKEMDCIHPEQKVSNANRKHSWFIKICSNVFDRQIPNWFCKLWTLYGPSMKILPEHYKKLYSEWVDVSAKLTSLQRDNIFSEGM
ncbi:hypothetical protein H5410_060507 [Solanum commersonii]|uniref:Uncharacterized protein n=1 Tax=Solanum commersonii TaxID=4109 RepID=A0A9J5W592_SOLCO|nr:hypothetical protein H5410_060507 [Solanum commersonii]